MAVFGVEVGRLTPWFGYMFNLNVRNAAGFPTSNIAPPGRPIAYPVSFFIRFFLAKPFFFWG